MPNTMRREMSKLRKFSGLKTYVVLVLCLSTISWIVTDKVSGRFHESRLSIEVLPKNIFTFGVARPGQTISHTFTLKNNGDSRVKLLGVRSTCSCSVAELEKDGLDPGESTDVTVSLQTKGLYGQIEKIVHVLTKPTTKFGIPLKLVGLVEYPWAPFSKTVHFEYTESERRNKTIESQFHLKATSLQAPNTLRVSPKTVPEYLEIKLHDETSGQYTVEVSLDIARAPRTFSQNIVLSSLNKVYPNYQFNVQGSLLYSYRSIPNQVLFGIVQRGQKYIKHITLIPHKTTGMGDILRISASPEKHISITRNKKHDAENSIALDVILDISADTSGIVEGGKTNGTIYISNTNDEVLLEIPVSFFIIKLGTGNAK